MDQVTMKALSDSIVQQIKAEMMTYFDAKVEPILRTLNVIQSSLSTVGEHVSQLEQRVGANEDNVHDLTNRIIQLEKDNAYLMEKVDDLENRSRSLNLRFLRVPETPQEDKDPIGFMAGLIPHLLGPSNFPTPLAIEKAHRNPTFRRDDKRGPRPILIKLQHFPVK